MDYTAQIASLEAQLSELTSLVIRYEAGTLSEEERPSAPFHVLRNQMTALQRYIYTLRVRAEAERA